MNATQLLQHFDRLAEAPDAVPRLRRFILDLAVRGKLVEQDAGDEPASELLRRIVVAQSHGYKNAQEGWSEADSKAKKKINPFELPENWIWTNLLAIAKFSAGRTPSRHDAAYWNTGHYPWVSIRDMKAGETLHATSETISELAKTYVFGTEPVPAGTLLMSFKLTIGKVVRLGMPAFHNEAIVSIRPSLSELDPYLFLALPLFSQSGKIKDAIKGATLNRESLSGIPISLPPLAEQHRIVAKVDELMALCDQLEAAQQERERRRDRLAAASLQRLNQPAADTTPEAQREHARFHLQHLPSLTTRPEHIKATRQTIHNLAIRGRLVLQSVSEQSARELLNQMQLQKTQLISDGMLPKAKELDPIGAEDVPSSLPEAWCWTRIESVCSVIVDCPHSTAVFIPKGVVCLDTNSFKAGVLTPQKIRYVSEETYAERIKRLEPQGGDLVFAREGSVGESVLVPDGMRCCLGQRVMLFRPLKGIAPSYFQLALSEPSFLIRLLTLHKGVGAKHVNVADMRNALLPLPPLAEQHRIVAKVDELMALCDQLEAQLSTTQTDSRRLLESVLEAALAPAH